MDPDANHKESLELATRILASVETAPDSSLEEDATRLAELVIALHEWISRGGFLPKDWRPR